MFVALAWFGLSVAPPSKVAISLFRSPSPPLLALSHPFPPSASVWQNERECESNDAFGDRNGWDDEERSKWDDRLKPAMEGPDTGKKQGALEPQFGSTCSVLYLEAQEYRLEKSGHLNRQFGCGPNPCPFHVIPGPWDLPGLISVLMITECAGCPDHLNPLLWK
ncbi:hypothetical protein BDK51DRAFT_41544 [Blyttiomyces helicus]|uniref:Uncharacterized protein n=1 Tax=Blyttiomyces helicus TaxID=388810 RepID=A0A4P9WPW7_9FUNG|nr:hypothetical protein BDK51DRAFT_41544 [Blyttiomyces helicus]|eukprot:RKO93808.1 hypothetical protein BDK51DRAFT_41544 [Blyttiomyces helicus]